MWRHDYSWADAALSCGATVLLAILAVTSLGLRYASSPISCWTPSQFTLSHLHYTNHRCFYSTEVYLPLTQDIPPRSAGQFSMWPTYHHWVPFALGVGSLLCLFPHVVWRLLSGFLWLDPHSLLSTLAENQRQAAERRHVMLRDAAILLQAGLKRGNFFLTVGALFRKLLSCVTCVVLVVLVVVLFRPQLGEERESDWDIARNMNGTIPLPTSTMCDFEIRLLTNVHMYTVQCVLPVNQVYSKGFTFLFYFFLLLAVVCTLDLLVWVGRVIIPGLRDAAVQRYLDAVAGSESGGGVSQLYTRFSESLGWDGRLVLALTADYCGPVAAADLTNHLWVIFKGVPRFVPAVAAVPSDPIFPESTGAAFGASASGAVSTVPGVMEIEKNPL